MNKKTIITFLIRVLAVIVVLMVLVLVWVQELIFLQIATTSVIFIWILVAYPDGDKGEKDSAYIRYRAARANSGHSVSDKDDESETTNKS